MESPKPSTALRKTLLSVVLTLITGEPIAFSLVRKLFITF